MTGQVIPAEAVEAAAKAMYAQDGGVGEFSLGVYEDYAKAMLEAAAPHMLNQSTIDQIRRESYEAGRDQALAGVTPIYETDIAGAWDEGRAEGYEAGRDRGTPEKPNPYRPTP